MFKSLLSVVVFLLAFGANSSVASTISWTVTKISGEVFISVFGKPDKLLKLGEFVNPGDTVRTFSDGTVALTRDAEAMIISTNAEMNLPIVGNTNIFTTITQTKGTILFSAKKKQKKHFKINTPFAVAIVKGTTFSINANDQNIQLQVFEGSVNLSGTGRNNTTLITAGIKCLVPGDLNIKSITKKVANADENNPHLGNDIDELSSTYLNRIEVTGRKADNFTTF